MPAPAGKDVLLKKCPGAPEKFIGVAVSTLREVGEPDLQEGVAAWLRPGPQLLRHFGPFQVQPERVVEVEQLEMDPTNAVWDTGHKELVPGSGRIVAEPPVPLQRLLVLSLRGVSVANMKGGSAEIESR